jgi:glycogen operon protein
MAMEITRGDPSQLGARVGDTGTHFALFSAHAEAVELCLFDDTGRRQIASLAMPGRDGDIWHGLVPGLGSGACYGYRVHGPHDPAAGLRFNPHKLLLDPYARQLRGDFIWDHANFGYYRDGSDVQDLSFSTLDNSAFVPKAVVLADQPVGDAANPRVDWADSLIYEAHVRGLTRLHPEVASSERGTFAGMACKQMVQYIQALGVTSVQLLPVHAFIDEYALYERGLSNYWGYNTLSFFAPHPAYLSSADVMEFRRLVDAYHAVGIEVLLDVVYNHSCESDELGPTLSLRGIDNRSYYRLQADNPRFYVNDTGCGNTLDLDHPRVRQLVVDSLVYWTEVMGVDGFRFDLAPVLGRSAEGFSSESAFFSALQKEPALARSKLIAEPWDIGPGGYQLGGFPHPWSEWNDRYRDSLRRFWRGDRGELPELARRIQGSADIFEATGRPPSASINYVSSHDGFTLHDLVSYEQRHNDANGEHNRDGHGENFSANYGHEGSTQDPQIRALRQRQQRNFLALLALSQGVPMLQAGDELGRSTRGNNNAYCQDNALNWLDWEQGLSQGAELLEFTRRLLAMRRALPLLRADGYRHDDPHSPGGAVLWFGEDGEPASEARWHDEEQRSLAFVLRRDDDEGIDELLVLINAAAQDLHFRLPPAASGGWQLALDTAIAGAAVGGSAVLECVLLARSLQVFLPLQSALPDSGH